MPTPESVCGHSCSESAALPPVGWVLCDTPRPPSDPPSGHPQRPPLGRGPPAAGMGVSTWTPPGQRRGPVPSAVWTRHGAVAQGQSGTTSRGNGRGCVGVCGGGGQLVWPKNLCMVCPMS